MVKTAPIAENKSDSYPGADYEAFGAISQGQCCMAGTALGLAQLLSAAGVPYTIKGRKCFFDSTAAELEDLCFGADPVVQFVSPDPIDMSQGFRVLGYNFGGAEGSVWLTDNASWSASGTRVQQTVTDWRPIWVDCGSPVQDGLPMDPAHVYIFVFNNCGERNGTGLETELWQPPP